MSSGLIVIIGAITTATRLEKRISQASGISTKIVHTPEDIGGGGCSYSIKTKAENLPIVMEVVKKYNFKIKGYYIIEIVGGKEVFHAIS